MPTIKNKQYNEFRNGGFIHKINKDHLTKALDNVFTRYKWEARSLLILLFWTGARPSEILDLKAKDISRDGNFVTIKMPGKKRGNSRIIYISLSRRHIREVYDYATSMFDDVYLFYHYKGKYTKRIKNKKGEIKEYETTSEKLYYHFKRWFRGVIPEIEDIPPYYLRHNLFSTMSENGATPQDIMYMKGSKTLESAMPYIHVSKKKAKDLSKFNK